MLIDRPPITQGWQLLAMLALGCVVVAMVHRLVKRRIAEKRRQQAVVGSAAADRN